jgi:hypothetical protein
MNLIRFQQKNIITHDSTFNLPIVSLRKNCTFRRWFCLAMQSVFKDKYYALLICQTFVDETKTLYSLKPE